MTSFLLFFAGKELPYENTWNGISIPQHRCQPLTTATMQKSPTTEFLICISNSSKIPISICPLPFLNPFSPVWLVEFYSTWFEKNYNFGQPKILKAIPSPQNVMAHSEDLQTYLTVSSSSSHPLSVTFHDTGTEISVLSVSFFWFVFFDIVLGLFFLQSSFWSWCAFFVQSLLCDTSYPECMYTSAIRLSYYI